MTQPALSRMRPHARPEDAPSGAAEHPRSRTLFFALRDVIGPGRDQRPGYTVMTVLCRDQDADVTLSGHAPGQVVHRHTETRGAFDGHCGDGSPELASLSRSFLPLVRRTRLPRRRPPAPRQLPQSTGPASQTAAPPRQPSPVLDVGDPMISRLRPDLRAALRVRSHGGARRWHRPGRALRLAEQASTAAVARRGGRAIRVAVCGRALGPAARAVGPRARRSGGHRPRGRGRLAPAAGEPLGPVSPVRQRVLALRAAHPARTSVSGARAACLGRGSRLRNGVLVHTGSEQRADEHTASVVNDVAGVACAEGLPWPGRPRWRR